jgi:hypothetical protein
MTEPFKLLGDRITVPVVEDLSNTERAMLRGLAEPGAPLWKIMRKMFDYADDLKQSLISVDLTDEASLKAAAKIQATIIAAYWVQQTFETALTDVDEPEEKEIT